MRVRGQGVSTTIEIARKTNKRSVIPIHVLSSPDSCLSHEQAINFMGQAGQRIANAPFAGFIRPEIKVTAVFCGDSRFQTDDQLSNAPVSSYSAPDILKPTEGFVAYYMPFEQKLFFNSSRLAAGKRAIVNEIATHELLHALSPRPPQQLAEDVWVQGTGIASTRFSTKIILQRENVNINEGIVELLRVDSLPQGDTYVNAYSCILEAMRIVAGKIGLNAIYSAHFNNDVDFLASSLTGAYGDQALKKLDCLASLAIDGQPYQRYYKNALLNFAENGIESYAMQYWGYTAEDRARMPRRIKPESIPGKLGEMARKMEVRVFTNLSKKAFSQFQIQLAAAQGQLTTDKFTHEDEFLWALTQAKTVLFIRKDNNYQTTDQSVHVLVEAREHKERGVPLIPDETETHSSFRKKGGEIILESPGLLARLRALFHLLTT